MRKLFIEQADAVCILTGDDHKHLSLVLRAKRGDTVAVSTGDGFDYTYTVDSISARETILKKTRFVPNETEPFLSLTLFSAVLKGDKNDTVVRMCTELGVACIIPFTGEYTVATKDSCKVERLQKIALEAAKQSGRGRVPKICAPLTFDRLVEKLPEYELAVFPFERARDTDIKTFLRVAFDKPCGGGGKKMSIAAIVGGEGGFSESEAARLQAFGVIPVTLGRRILRADTACAAVCALILYEAGEMK